MNDRVAVARLFAHQPDGRCSDLQTDRNEPDRFRGNLQQKYLQNFFARCAREGVVGWSGIQTDRPAVGAASRPTSGRSLIYYTVDLYSGRGSRSPVVEEDWDLRLHAEDTT